MTAKQRKKLCRIKVERFAKLITAMCVIIIMTLVEYAHIDGYTGGIIATIIWFLMPDFAAYILEKYYKITHNFVTYR